jgi:hypothetical protein
MKFKQLGIRASAVHTPCILGCGGKPPKRIISVLLVVLVVSHLSIAEETSFNGVKVADAKGKQADGRLIFSDSNKNVVVRSPIVTL